MSKLSFSIPPIHGNPKGRNESLPSFVARKPYLKLGEVHVQVIPPQGEIVWTTGQYISPR